MKRTVDNYIIIKENIKGNIPHGYLLYSLFLLLSLSFPSVIGAQTSNYQSRAIYDDGEVKIKWLPTELTYLRSHDQKTVRLDKYRSTSGSRELIQRYSISTAIPLDKSAYSSPNDSGFFLSISDTFLVELRNEQTEFGRQNLSDFALLSGLLGLEMNYTLAEDLGYAFTDREVDTTQDYVYELYIYNKDEALIYENTFELSYPVIMPKPKLPGATWSCLQNDIRMLLQMPDATAWQYVGYYVERSIDNGKSFEVLNELPLLSNTSREDTTMAFLLYNDSLGPFEEAQYRFRGLNSFGQYGPYSDTLHVINDCHIPYVSPVISCKEEGLESSQVSIEWNFPDSLNQYLEGFNIYRRYDYLDGQDSLLNAALLDTNRRKFIDMAPERAQYYTVEAVFITGLTTKSFESLVQLKDTVPPAPPILLEAILDTSDYTVRLTWKKSPEVDFKTYTLYSAWGDPDNRIVQTPSIYTDTTFIDTIKPTTYSNTLYYVITAMDQNFNESLLSDSLIVHVPDTFAPFPSRIRSWFPRTEGVYMEYSMSPSNDVVRYVIERSPIGSTQWQTIYETDKPVDLLPKEFVDEDLSEGDTAYYRIVVYDSSQNLSVSEPKRMWRPSGPLPPIEYVEYVIAPEDSSAYIYWDYPEGTQLSRFYLLAKKSEDGNLWKEGKYEAEDLSIREGITKENTPYTYRLYRLPITADLQRRFQYFSIRAHDTRGLPSEISTWVEKKN